MTHSTHMVGVSLSNLIGILPIDFMVTVKIGDIEVLKGITWVIPYDSKFYLYRERDVASFRTDFYNTEIIIDLRA